MNPFGGTRKIISISRDDFLTHQEVLISCLKRVKIMNINKALLLVALMPVCAFAGQSKLHVTYDAKVTGGYYESFNQELNKGYSAITRLHGVNGTASGYYLGTELVAYDQNHKTVDLLIELNGVSVTQTSSVILNNLSLCKENKYEDDNVKLSFRIGNDQICDGFFGKKLDDQEGSILTNVSMKVSKK
ncbi:hypothetical protein Sps_01237 [Shewanella psychrophila]|uniref:Uncharacterized protein n=2 Tax=Shewanella psychrophila TaxID=225848 RepID=A0A1S6HLJ9_9GAMM|nr:hypothetical protein Sps_01237 [Shewanella psychrophila]